MWWKPLLVEDMVTTINYAAKESHNIILPRKTSDGLITLERDISDAEATKL